MVGPWHGLLYGFYPTLLWTLLILLFLITLNVTWAMDGSLDFHRLQPKAAVEGAVTPQHLLLFRSLCLLLTLAPCVLSVRIYRQRRQESGEPLILGGLEILLTFCTLWSLA